MRRNKGLLLKGLTENYIEFDSNNILNLMLGEQSVNLVKLQNILNVRLDMFGNKIRILGNKKVVHQAETLLKNVYGKLITEENSFSKFEFSDFETELRIMKAIKLKVETKKAVTLIKTWKKSVVPKSLGQEKYLNALNNFELVFGLGPAGTGKSYLAVAKGIELLKNGSVDKIILSRPAVEAGENLGFLPGDLKEKVDPYLRPIYDALYEMIPFDRVEKKIENGEIEIAPLAFMRGRTFENSFIIIDEAQNTTAVQMKMILTRIGNGSRMVVNGDLTQIDIPKGVDSGLSVALEKLNKVKKIKIVELSQKDVVRHPLVAEIIKAYDKK